MYSWELYPSTAPGTERETNEVYNTEFTNPVGFYPLSLDSHWSQANQNKTKAHSCGGPKYNILHPSSWVLPLLILWDRWLHYSDFSQSVSSVASRPGLPGHHQLPESTQTHVHQVGDAIQPSHPLSSPSPPAFNLSHIRSFQMSQLFASGGQNFGVSASTSVLQWTPRTDLL